MLVIKGLNWAGMWGTVTSAVRGAVVSITMFNGVMAGANMQSLGFITI